MKLFGWEVMKKLESLAAAAGKVNKLLFNENSGGVGCKQKVQAVERFYGQQQC